MTALPPLSSVIVADPGVRRVELTNFGVTNRSSPMINTKALQAAIDTGAAEITIPPYAVRLSGRVELGDRQTLVGVSRARSVLEKAEDQQGPLVYAAGKAGCGIRSLTIDGRRSQSKVSIPGTWNVFFTQCTEPFVVDCDIVGSLCDNIVFELCKDALSKNCRSNDSNKGGFYWSSCDGGVCIDCTADNHGASASGIGNGFLVACTWDLAISNVQAKNNLNGQIILSRDSRNVIVHDAILGARDQDRGQYGLYVIGERITGPVHGRIYDGKEPLGASGCQFVDIQSFLPVFASKFRDSELLRVHIDVLSCTLNAAALFGCRNVKFTRVDFFNWTTGSGIVLQTDDGAANAGIEFFDSSFRHISAAKKTRIQDLNGGSKWREWRSQFNGVAIAS